MSTRSTLKNNIGDDNTGYHLHQDLDLRHRRPRLISLELNGVEFECRKTQYGSQVLVHIPEDWAVELGLIDSDTF